MIEFENLKILMLISNFVTTTFHMLIVRNQIPGRQFKRLKLQSGNLIFVVELKSIFLLLKNCKKKKNCKHESTMNFHYSQIIIINYFCNLYKIAGIDEDSFQFR